MKLNEQLKKKKKPSQQTKVQEQMASHVNSTKHWKKTEHLSFLKYSPELRRNTSEVILWD